MEEEEEKPERQAAEKHGPLQGMALWWQKEAARLSHSHISTENHHCKCNCLNRQVHPPNSPSASLEIFWKPTGKQLSRYRSRAALVRKRNFGIQGNWNERNMQIEPYLYTHMLTMHTLICLSIIYKCPPVKLKADATQLKSHLLNSTNPLSLITSTLQHSAFV